MPEQTIPSESRIEGIIHDAVRRAVQVENDLIEEYCERSLTDSQGRGVLIYRHTDGIEIGLDHSVPWGTIHEHIRSGTVSENMLDCTVRTKRDEEEQ